MTRQFKIFVELPDGKGGKFTEEIDELCQDNYPDECDTNYFMRLAHELFPDAFYIQVYELAEEIKLKQIQRKAIGAPS